MSAATTPGEAELRLRLAEVLVEHAVATWTINWACACGLAGQVPDGDPLLAECAHHIDVVLAALDLPGQLDRARQGGRQEAADDIRAGIFPGAAMPQDLRRPGRPSTAAYAEWAARIAESAPRPRDIAVGDRG